MSDVLDAIENNDSPSQEALAAVPPPVLNSEEAGEVELLQERPADMELQGSLPDEEPQAVPDESAAVSPEPDDSDKGSANKRIQQLIEQRNELQQRLQRNEELAEKRFAELVQRMERANAEPEPVAPDFDEDPAGNLQFQQEQLRKQQEQMQKAMQQQQQQNAYQARANALRDRYMQSQAALSQQHPDYQARVQALENQRIAFHESLGFSREQAQARTSQEAWGIIQDAIQNGKDPAQAIYQMAQASTPQPQAAPADEPGRKRGTVTSIGSRGAAPKGKMTAARLLAMSDDEFAQATSGDKWRKLHLG